MSGDTPEVVLGFVEEAERWRLLPQQFPSKVGGRPAWLSPTAPPAAPELGCEVCGLPMVFLLQVSQIITNYSPPPSCMLFKGVLVHINRLEWCQYVVIIIITVICDRFVRSSFIN